MLLCLANQQLYEITVSMVYSFMSYVLMCIVRFCAVGCITQSPKCNHLQQPLWHTLRAYSHQEWMIKLIMEQHHPWMQVIN